MYILISLKGKLGLHQLETTYKNMYVYNCLIINLIHVLCTETYETSHFLFQMHVELQI